MTKDFWDARYSETEFAYGTDPNTFFSEQLMQLEEKGSILFPADGQGRNGVFAAEQGWKVTSFDLSSTAKIRADELAKQKGVVIDFQVGAIGELDFPKDHFDALVLVFAHFPESHRRTWHRLLASYLKPGGVLILEAFSKKHLSYNSQNPSVGGPRDASLLFSKSELEEDFESFTTMQCIETTAILHEGPYHAGEGAVVQFVGKK